MTSDQNAVLFEIHKTAIIKKSARKAEKHAAEAKTVEFKLVKEAKKHALEIKLMHSELIVHIAAMVNFSNSVSHKICIDNKKIEGEIPTKIKTLTLEFVGLSQKKEVKIYHNKFKLVNFLHLHHMQSCHFEKLYDKDCGWLSLKNSTIRLKKVIETYKDFEKTFQDMWSESFLNYSAIMVFFFGLSKPTLHRTLSRFYSDIFKFSWVYNWEDAVLLIAIKLYYYIIAHQLSDTTQ